jgi:hypothetical protein
MKKATLVERERAVAFLRDWIVVGTRVFTLLRSAPRSRRRREIGVVVWDRVSGRPFHPEFHVGRALDLRLGRRGGLVVHGGGVDAGQELVKRLAVALHGDPAALTHEWL